MIQRYLPVLITTVVFIVAYLTCAIRFDNFASFYVIGSLLTDNAFLGVVAVGMTFVILSGGIDLSVASVIAFTIVLLAVLIEHLGIHPLAAFAIVLVIGGLFGGAMGALIHYLKMPAFIVTLAGMFLARGAAYLLTTESIPIKHPFYDELNDLAVYVGDGRLSLIAIMMLLVFVFGYFLAHRTRFGANVFAIGGSPASAELMGVPIARTTIRIYMLSSLLATLSGIVFSIYTAAGYPLAVVGVELDAIATVVIGGTLLTGGYGHMLGTFIGLLIQGLIQIYITFDGTLSSWWTKIVVGLLLFSFIGLQKLLALVWTVKAPTATATAKA
jgi:galactofuranose transport system permease protein